MNRPGRPLSGADAKVRISLTVPSVLREHYRRLELSMSDAAEEGMWRRLKDNGYLTNLKEQRATLDKIIEDGETVRKNIITNQEMRTQEFLRILKNKPKLTLDGITYWSKETGLPREKILGMLNAGGKENEEAK